MYSGFIMTKQTNFPKTLQQAIIYFSDADNCTTFLSQLRWPEGVTCPNCDGDKVSYLSTRRVWKCKGCKKQFSVKIGTVMEDSPIGLDKWMAAIWLIVNAKNGISSHEVARALGVTQKSGWFLLHRIRLAMQTGTFKKLSGTVEADETVIGGMARFMHKHKRAAKITGTGASGKVLVMGLLERHGEVVCKVVSNTSQEVLQREVRRNVEQGANLMTDGWQAYTGLSGEYVHEFVNHAETYVRGNVHTNGIENFWCLLKRSIKGTYVSVEPFHLFRYLDEQSFRFNNRKANDAERFVEVAGMVAGKRLTYAELTGKNLTDEESRPKAGN